MDAVIDDEAVLGTVDAVVDDEDGYGSLSQYMAEPSVSLYQYPDKVFFKLNLLTSDEGTTLDTTFEIPSAFKSSLFCQAIIAFCYTDGFRGLGDNSKYSYINLFKRFFSFLLNHDANCGKEKKWSELLALTSGDLPFTVMHDFFLHLSEDGTGASSLSGYQFIFKKSIAWATEFNVKTRIINLENGDKLLPYLKNNVNPKIKPDDKKPRPALSQLFSIDYGTGEEIQCPYSDSQLITNLRWFAKWYLNVMRERRLFFRKIKWDKNRTIYEVLTERLSNGTWSIDSKPVISMFRDSDEDKAIDLPLFFEASSMYAKIYEALLPSKSEIEQIENDTFSAELASRLMWLEPLGLNMLENKSIFNKITNYESNIDVIIKRSTQLISYNASYFSTSGKGRKKVPLPICLAAREATTRRVIIPKFSLIDMIVPTNSERLVMSWLLASDCIQWSNQTRLNLRDFKQSERSKTLKILTVDNSDEVDVNEVKIRHFKGRSNGGNVRRKIKGHETITYKLGDPLMTTYTNWKDDMTEAQVHIKKGKGKWFHASPARNGSLNSVFTMSFLCAKNSLLRMNYEKAEKELKYHSELNGEGAFRWLFTKYVKHMAYLSNTKTNVSEINLSSDAIRQSRIIFTENQDMTDAENAKETAHNEQQVALYREAGVAKERILNGIKGNVQVANKMTDESISILDSCHLMSVDEVQKSLHDPSGFTVNDVVKFINEIAANPEKYDVTIFGGIIDKADPDAGIKIINDKNSAMMMWSYIKHMESELQSIEENHDEEQIVKHLFEHAQWSILFERFPVETQAQGKALADQYTIPYPPLF
ncbi:MAG: hypothetical protein HRU40_02975 [Saprospiraceae bacterium]|nr:hypothetical protein [Saprospiraceae bacterium]